MKKLAEYGKKAEDSWHQFVIQENLTAHQADLFEQYALKLLAFNEKTNITAITEITAVIRDHFQDSLAVQRFLPFSSAMSLCDVGSGGGFPGIPLKIMHPEIPMVLLEVNQKKINFLETMINELNLPDIQVCSLDYRTFLRKAPYAITHFLARASLRPEELIRAFKSGSSYQEATVIYWASALWKISSPEIPYFDKEESYTLDHKNRRLIFFSIQR